MLNVIWKCSACGKLNRTEEWYSDWAMCLCYIICPSCGCSTLQSEGLCRVEEDGYELNDFLKEMGIGDEDSTD